MKDFDEHLKEEMENPEFRKAWEERERREQSGELDIHVSDIVDWIEAFVDHKEASIVESVDKDENNRIFVILCPPGAIQVNVAKVNV